MRRLPGEKEYFRRWFRLRGFGRRDPAMVAVWCTGLIIMDLGTSNDDELTILLGTITMFGGLSIIMDLSLL